jgi:ribosomal protein S18 acetylase RimI-like enzyme
MTDAPEPHSVGMHQLGPRVVGQRVVVRYLLPDGRATDVLGTCVSWGAEELVVHQDGGEPVTIRVTDVVTGKPVPPRPSVRHRVAAQDVELHVASLWPDMTTEPLDGWLLRACPPQGGRLRRRGNSALAMAEPDVRLSAATAAVRSFYADLGQDPLIQVQADSPLELALAPLGFTPLGDGDAHCQLAAVSRALRSCNTLSGALSRRTDDAVQHRTACYIEEGANGVRVSLEEGTASGRAALDGDWLGLHDLLVDPSHRRQGLGTRVIAELLDWGASRGATTAWLHVETDNEAGLATYERLGFVTHHTNRYLSG